MKRFSVFIVIAFTLIITDNLVASESQYFYNSGKGNTDFAIRSDTLKENQILYNGRIWKNLYYNVEGDQFLFSKTFLPGSLVIRGIVFENIQILYDICNDELLIPFNKGGVLQVNKAMVDSFSFNFLNKSYHFIRIPGDTLLGYLNIIYKGKTALYVKYTKKIEKLAEQGKYDLFYQSERILFAKDSSIYTLTGKKNLLKILGEDKEAVSDYIRKNRIKLSESDPESFIPVIRYLDEISH